MDKTLKEDVDEGDVEDNQEPTMKENTKDWVHRSFHGKKEKINKQDEETRQFVEGEKTNQHKKESMESEPINQEEPATQEEGVVIEEENAKKNEGIMVVYEMGEEEALPLDFQNDVDYRDIEEQKEVSANGGDMAPNITKVVMEGDLSPKQINKLREAHTKQKKQGEKDIVGAQASSRQSKRTITKNSEYQ
ncbi:hypothetical protein KY285_008111 [Solanum tuberosum]|nr:hypothetical protein KY285_008111 [Solanum tuberosum]